MLMRGFPVYTGVKITFSMLRRKGGFRAELQYANLWLEIEVSTTIIIRGHVRKDVCSYYVRSASGTVGKIRDLSEGG